MLELLEEPLEVFDCSEDCCCALEDGLDAEPEVPPDDVLTAPVDEAIEEDSLEELLDLKTIE